MSNPYPNEKFTRAVHSMAVSPKSIQDRVAEAHIESLIHVDPKDLPESIRYRFTELLRKLTSEKPIGTEGTVLATTNKMSAAEASEIAQEIVTLADSVSSDYNKL